MNCPMNCNDDTERRKTNPLLLPKIEAGTKSEELMKNTVGESMKSNKKALEQTQAVYGNGVHKSADKSMYKQVQRVI